MLLHVLVEVRLLCVALCTDVTYVLLYVLPLDMLQDVLLKIFLVIETPVAGVTLVRFVLLMCPGNIF